MKKFPQDSHQSIKREINNSNNEPMYRFLMLMGALSGCHQDPERSFTYRDKQFPVCARCTGVFVGYLIAFSLFAFIDVNINILIAGCSVMFFDWYIQKTEILFSTNRRRLITGVIGGFSLMMIYIRIIVTAVGYFVVNI